MYLINGSDSDINYFELFLDWIIVDFWILKLSLIIAYL